MIERMKVENHQAPARSEHAKRISARRRYPTLQIQQRKFEVAKAEHDRAIANYDRQ